ncbi:Protein of unknown function [Chryseobacterium carnipullorum]|uniref:DUF262 domain-containing protein n=1 Tax=Chryseobacterium carnipullorum TaxID=1124835 RepID=UPI000921A039|nr:DUF262 domain-containing protein [Chryseobacterium carnipullorum]SHM01549.1 Protein of unknown function [Chryseobacterium carnipullorum]
METITESDKNRINLVSIKNFNDLEFIIGNYQRGYKWGKKEILELLNDIDEFNSNGFYCLQPLILYPIAENETITFENDFIVNKKNEIIDGQQRTTSIFLILEYLKHRGFIKSNITYKITFNTRERSKEFLENHLYNVYNIDISTLSSEDISSDKYDDFQAVNHLWEKFIEDFKDYDNVDVYHFFVVNIMIKKWLDNFISTGGNIAEYVDKLLKDVKVIWYELGGNEKEIDKKDIIKVFQNNNNNKIKLTNSELIKALFILQIKKNHIAEIAEFETNRFAMEWDMIENQLQDKSFWYFICSNFQEYDEGTHIDLLFDIINDRPKKTDNFYSYRKYEKKYNQNEVLDWNVILELYYKLLDWYNDKSTYHYIGFLINANISSLPKIYKLSHNRKKDDFLDKLKKQIIKEFKKIKDEELVYQLDNLDYDKNKNAVKTVLLLFNVMYYVNDHSNHKFPFELYVEENWSIEHINPQNPRDLDDFESYKNWFFELIEDLDEYKSIIENDLSRIFNKADSFESLSKEMNNRLQEISIILQRNSDTHKIQNLALIDCNTNSALGNNLFKRKREKILLFDSVGKVILDGNELPVFIPQETKNVFNKSYSETQSLKENRWTRSDAQCYKMRVFSRLEEFYNTLADEQ